MPGQNPGGKPGEGRTSLSVLAIVGPTGTGKSATALQLAKHLDIEIIGCDALQVYRGLDAATAKPTREERSVVPHHLIDVVDPGGDFTLADYVGLAERAVDEIWGRGRIPVVVGGTGLYLRGLLRGIIPAPSRDTALRTRLRRMLARYGAPRLHRWLAVLDPASADRLPVGDVQRIVRALEIALEGEKSWSERLRQQGTWSEGRERYGSLKIGLDMDRDVLKGRLRRRVDVFFRNGLVEETRGLRAAGVPDDANAFKAIGYREVLAAIVARTDPEAEREQIYRRTRDYAKRQRTWFRKEPCLSWLDAATGPERLADRIARLWSKHSASA